MDYDLDIVLIAHFADRVHGNIPKPLGQFGLEMFERYNGLIEARLAGLDAKQRSTIAVLAFLAPGQTVAQCVDAAVATFTAANV